MQKEVAEQCDRVETEGKHSSGKNLPAFNFASLPF